MASPVTIEAFFLVSLEVFFKGSVSLLALFGFNLSKFCDVNRELSEGVHRYVSYVLVNVAWFGALIYSVFFVVIGWRKSCTITVILLLTGWLMSVVWYFIRVRVGRVSFYRNRVSYLLSKVFIVAIAFIYT